MQGKYEEADPLYRRIQEILGATVGEEHPNYASTLTNRAKSLNAQVIKYRNVQGNFLWLLFFATCRQCTNGRADSLFLGQVRRGGTVVRQSNFHRREGPGPGASRSCRVAQQQGGVAGAAGERRTNILGKLLWDDDSIQFMKVICEGNSRGGCGVAYPPGRRVFINRVALLICL